MTAANTPLDDTHCHLMLSQYDQDRSQVIERAREAGVHRLLVPGLDLETSRQAVELANQCPMVYAAVGIHPHNANTWNRSHEQEFRSLARSKKVVAIGEIGLDYFRNLSPPEIQRKAFQAQLDLAAELELPVVIHNRAATDHVMEFILGWSTDLPPRLKGRAGVLHANSANLKSTQIAISEGFYIGVAGSITYNKADELRFVVTQLPHERLLLETDAPYLTPHPNRGKRNEPVYVKLIAEKCATILNTSVEFVAGMTSQNAGDLFRWNHGYNNSHIL